MGFLILLVIAIIVVVLCCKLYLCSDSTFSSSNHDYKITQLNEKNEFPINKSKRSDVTSENQVATKLNINLSYEFDKVEKEYPVFDSTKIPITKYCQYKVKGKNPKTNRMKTNTVVVEQGTSDEIIMQKSGLLEPYTITPYIEAPSIPQITYANNLNIIFSSDCSMADLSCLIDMQLDGCYDDLINNDLLEYASDNNIYISPFSSDSYGVYKLIKSLPTNERIVFFVYLIYVKKLKIGIANLNQSQHKEIFYDYLQNVHDISETSDLIKEHYTSRLIIRGDVDKRNKKMVQLYDSILDYLRKREVN